MLVRILVYTGFLLSPVPGLILIRYLYRPGVLMAPEYDPAGRSPFEMESHPVNHFKSRYHKIVGLLAFFLPWLLTVAFLIYVGTVWAGL